MNFEILPTPPANQLRTAHTQILLQHLRDFLRLPPGITITAVRPDPNNAAACILDLAGYGLPADGELAAHYRFQHHTIPTFDHFEPVP